MVWRHLPWAWVMEVGTSVTLIRDPSGLAQLRRACLAVLGDNSCLSPCWGCGGNMQGWGQAWRISPYKAKGASVLPPSAPGALLDSQLSHILTGASLEPHLFMVP